MIKTQPKHKSPAFGSIMILTSTLPIDVNDPLPTFVKEQAEWFKKLYPRLKVSVVAPHSAYSKVAQSRSLEFYDEYRFHYFWPHRWELITGRGIMPALKQNKLLYAQIPFFVLAEIWATYRKVKKTKPDLLYAHWFTPQAISAYVVSKLTKVPYVFTTHASDAIVLRRLPFINHLAWSICNNALAYTAVSDYTAERLLSICPKDKHQAILTKLKVIPMGTEITNPPAATVAKIKQRYNPENKHVILFLGRLVSIKGIDDLLEAFNKLKAQNKHTKLIIAGEGVERSALEQQAAKLDLDKSSVEFVGYVSGDDKNALLKMADIICITSRTEGHHREGLPVVFMEGLGAGAIIIASDVSGANAYIQDGVNGFLYPQGDIDKLTSKLLEAVKMGADHRKKLKAETRLLAQRFQWQQVAKEHLEFFEQALEKS